MDYCSFCSVFVSGGGSEAGTSIATIIISGVVATVAIASFLTGVASYRTARSQKEIASTKIKLELYNRRFNIFLATLEYYFASYGKTDGDMKEKSRDFVKGCREAKFLFDKDDGIYDTLMRIMDHGSKIQAYEDAASGATPNVCNDAKRIMHESSVNARSAFEEDLHTLEDQLTKYITFKAVDGWGR